LAKERKIRRTQTAAQEQRKIERLLGEEFDSLAQARRALKQESKPVPEKKTKPKPKTDFKYGANKPTTKPKSKPASKPARFNPRTASRKEKFKHAQKIGPARYTKLLNDYWDDHPDEDKGDNPYCYHGGEK